MSNVSRNLDEQLQIPAGPPLLSGRHLLAFLLLFAMTLGLALGWVVWITGRTANPYPDGIDFSAMNAKQLVVINQVQPHYVTGLKVDHALKNAAPNIGAFGSHAIGAFSAAAAGDGQGGFFNFSVLHLGLPEIRDLMAHLKSKGKLPGKFIMVALQNPHTDNFTHITQYIRELPPEIYLLHGGERPTKNLRRAFQLLGDVIRDRLDWRKLAFALTDTCKPDYGVMTTTKAFAPRAAADAHSNLLGRLIIQLQGGVKKQNSCPPLLGLHRDGRNADPPQKSPTQIATDPIKSKAVPGGSAAVLSLMGDIARIGNGEGRRVIFFTPPTFETPRKSPQNTLMNQVVTEAAKRGMAVIDHRRGFTDGRYFRDYMHPNERYFTDLMKSAGELK
ncbi:MAG: hypothetical protein HOB37_01240 [Rhodospirillaceae bacterium]|nr:hypothetical protein [Rhodospirillaceae bacterium]MBT5298737.1 hypothetical protein [Rhodospirillaceae bacterium]MBT5514500.1 hypothetical protein [Rhodospirillaceae bacterium]MBT6084597.1 hypothetical protein [Rhodospirillaceae bacterium]MBT6607072.1 hypothetical protein [Rhodospirillaceae bacterium]